MYYKKKIKRRVVFIQRFEEEVDSYYNSELIDDYFSSPCMMYI